jgi:hypothetical protein
MKTGEEKEPLLFEYDEKYEWGTCPLCKAPWRFEDESAEVGDTIPLGGLIDRKIKKKVSYYASLLLYVCPACKGEFYFVEVDVIESPKVSEAWQECFFWRNLPETDFVTGETERNLTLNPVRGYGVLVEKTPTVEGVFYRNYIGPFVPESPLYGPNGLCSCAGAPDWQTAASLASLFINN